MNDKIKTTIDDVMSKELEYLPKLYDTTKSKSQTDNKIMLTWETDLSIWCACFKTRKILKNL